ncbi:MAG: hypothetical protein ACKVUS_05420 [Saprospiraceae bacterium]
MCANVRKFRKRTLRRVKDYFARKISLREFSASLCGWEGHALRANTWWLRKRLIKEFFGKKQRPSHKSRWLVARPSGRRDEGCLRPCHHYAP